MTKIITNFPDYSISTDGVVTKLTTGAILSTWTGANGYKHVDLRKDAQGYKISLHRLLAITFLPNLENKRTVNHIDGNKLNNVLNNLEWATDAENTQHAYDTGLQPYRRNYSLEEYMEMLEDFFLGESITSISKRVDQSLTQLSLHLREAATASSVLDRYTTELARQKAERAKRTGASRRNTINLQMLDIDTEEVLKTFTSVSEAKEYLDRKSSGPITNVISGRQKTAYGYKWKKI